MASLAFGQQTEILRPTRDFDGGSLALGCYSGSDLASSAMPKSWDQAGLSTSSNISVTGTFSKSQVKTRIFSSWAATSNNYSALTVSVNVTAGGNSGDEAALGCIKYSIDGGVTYTTLICDGGAGFANKTITATLSGTQDLSKLRVGVCASGLKGNLQGQIGPGSESLDISDVWTSGTNPAPATGNGSTSGQPHRGVVVSN